MNHTASHLHRPALMTYASRRAVARLDPRSPLVLDTRELGRRPGSMRTLTRTVEAPDQLGVDVVGVPPGSPIALDVRLESVVEGVLVTCSADVELVGECVRCLDPLARPMTVTLQELYAYPEAHAAPPVHSGRRGDAAGTGGTADPGDDEADLPVLEGDLLDLEPVLRDAVVLALPLRPVCRDNCPGLCPECGVRLADDPEHGHGASDPRWAALAGPQKATDHDDENDPDDEES